MISMDWTSTRCRAGLRNDNIKQGNGRHCNRPTQRNTPGTAQQTQALFPGNDMLSRHNRIKNEAKIHTVYQDQIQAWTAANKTGTVARIKKTIFRLTVIGDNGL
jgi:hypothetical protein